MVVLSRAIGGRIRVVRKFLKQFDQLHERTVLGSKWDALLQRLHAHLQGTIHWQTHRLVRDDHFAVEMGG